jgi:tetratricopeptide (TPR) repeat protein
VLATAPTEGPLEDKAPGLAPELLAELRIREARMTGDPGFYTLADAAAQCALARDPGDLAAQRARVHIAIQFHDFAAAERDARALAEKSGGWQDWLLVGDAAMERGEIDAARTAYEAGLAQRPGLQLYDRMGYLSWCTGDAELALEYAKAAASSGTAADPEPLAWTLTRVGWLHALAGEPAPEVSHALLLLPDYPPARFARGRIRLNAGDPGAAEDLRAAGHTVEATRALAELDPAVDVATVLGQDPRGAAIWLADRDPERALALLDEERKSREDAQTLLAWAYAAHRAGRDARDVARRAIDTGILEPRALLHGGIVLGDAALLDRAIASGPGLLPSERALAEREKAALVKP